MRWLEHVGFEVALPDLLSSKADPMTNQIPILAYELVLATILTMIMLMRQDYAARPQYLGSVGWHGGKRKR